MNRFALAASVSLATLFAGAAQAAPATYAIDAAHTFVTFEVTHFGTSTNRGRFDKKEGTVTIDKAAKTGSATISIDMNSINTGTAAFDGHLKKGFFEAEKFPTATFAGKQFVFDGDKVGSVSGDLTLHGVTKPVTLTAKRFNCYEHPRLKREVCGGDFETTIQRGDFGITELKGAVPEEVKLVIQVEAIQQQ